MDSILILFSEANVIPTLAMIFIACYWLMIVVGVVGMDSMDFDFDVDADIGIDADLDLDVDGAGDFGADPGGGNVLDAGGADIGGGGSTGPSGVNGLLRPLFEFLYMSDVPIVIVVSALMFGFWISNIALNLFFNPGQSFFVSLIWVIPNCIVALLVARVICIPAAAIGRKSPPEDNSRSNLLGRVGIVTTGHVDENFGQMEIKMPGEPEIKLNVRIAAGQRQLTKGDAAKIISYNDNNGSFLVELTKWEDNSDD